jgi:uncharacterized membrane protein
MRYIILVLLNLPVVTLAFVSLLTKYKTARISKQRFKSQILMWIGILIVVVGSFPIYNLLSGNPPLQSDELSLFDIVQTTVIVLLIYIINSQRQRVDRLDTRLRDLHQELSIQLSSKK